MERKAALEELSRDPEVIATSMPMMRHAVFVPDARVIEGTGRGVSWIRRALGDEPVKFFHFPQPFDPRGAADTRAVP